MEALRRCCCPHCGQTCAVPAGGGRCIACPVALSPGGKAFGASGLGTRAARKAGWIIGTARPRTGPGNGPGPPA